MVLKTKKQTSKDLFVNHLLSCGQVTFTTKSREFQQTLEKVKALGIKARVEQYSAFVVIVKC